MIVILLSKRILKSTVRVIFRVAGDTNTTIDNFNIVTRHSHSASNEALLILHFSAFVIKQNNMENYMPM